MIEIGRCQFFCGQSVEKRCTCHDVAVRRDLEGVDRERLGEQLSRRRFSQAPEVAVEAGFVVHSDHAGNRRQHDTAGAEDAGALGNDGRHVVDEVQRLRENDAVVGSRSDRVRMAEIGDDRRRAVGRIDVDDITRRDRVPAVLFRVHPVSDLEDSSSNVSPVSIQKALDVITVDGLPPIPAPVVAEWLGSPEITPVHPRDGSRFQRPNRFRDLHLEACELCLERRCSRFQRLPVLPLAQEEGLLGQEQFWSVPLDRIVVLGIKVSKSREVRGGLDRTPVAGSWTHAIVE